MRLRVLELVQEPPRRGDRQLVHEREHVCVARNELNALSRGEREQVIITGINGTHRRWAFGVRHDLRKLLEQGDEPACIFRCDSSAQLRSAERSLQLVEQRPADDELELTLEPQLNQTRRRAHSRDQSGNEDVSVEDCPHPLCAAAFVLRLHRDAESFVLVEVGRLPDALEQIESEITPKRFLDHVTVTAAATGRLHAHGTQNPLIERYRRSCLGHDCIIASM
jgi:hypothetical protein